MKRRTRALGLIVLTNMSVGVTQFFCRYVLNLLLEKEFDLNRGANDTIVAAHQDAAGALNAMAAQAHPVDAGAIAPFLGIYEHGDRLAYDAVGDLRLHLGGRALRVLAMPDGGYVAASGSLAGTPIQLVRDELGAPVMELNGQDGETVRWLSGPA